MKIKKYVYMLLGIIVLVAVFFRKKIFAFLTKTKDTITDVVETTKESFMSVYSYRGTDKFGSGHFGASRDNGKRKHKGVDIVLSKGEIFKVPFPSVIKRFGYPYSGDYKWRLVEFQGLGEYSEFTYKVMYVDVDNLEIGEEQNYNNSKIVAQGIEDKYQDITPHVHFELYKNGELVNPENYV